MTPIPPEIAHWALPALAAWAGLWIVWLKIRNPLRLRWITLKGDHLVIAGDDGLAARVAARARAARRRVILWVSRGSERWVRRAADRGAPHVSQRRAGGGVGRLGLARARAVLVAGADDTLNIRLAQAAADEANRVRPPGDPLEVIARVDDIDLQASLKARRAAEAHHQGARLRFASVPDITARALFVSQSLDRFTRVGQTGRLVFLLNFSPVLERLALRIIVGAHFRDGARPAFVVLDPAADRKRAVFLARNPGAEGLARMAFEAAAVDRPAEVEAALAAAIERHGRPTLILVDPGDAARALQIGAAVTAGFERLDEPCPPVHAHMPGEPDASRGCGLFAFGGLDRLATPERLLQEQSDLLARSVHEFYLEGQLDKGEQIGARSTMLEWSELPEAVRDDNRLVADCYALKLRDIGARLIVGEAEGLTFEGDELEQLARAEHERWMAARRAEGWVYGQSRDDGARRHPMIVAYDELTEETKALDREQIRIMARLVRQLGQCAVRDLVVAVDIAGGDARALAAGMGPAVAELQRRYPDRAIVLRGAFESPAARTAMIAGAKVGAFVQLTLASNADRVLGGLGGAARAEARQLYRDCDRWFACSGAEAAEARRRDFLLTHAEARIADADAGPSKLPSLILGGSATKFEDGS
jgi:hypothetical protein